MGIVSSKTPYEYTVTRHYYTDHRRFEQSLDVYEPYTPKATKTNEPKSEQEKKLSNNNVRPTVLLVTGSGWMGHVPWIYLGTTWWNSSGPATVAGKLGYRCISIRHSGAFFQIPDMTFTRMFVGTFMATLWGLVYSISCSPMAAASTVPSSCQVSTFPFTWLRPPASLDLCALDMFGWCYTTVATLLVSTSAWALMKWQARGAATFPNMLEDVDTALRFVHRSGLYMSEIDATNTTAATSSKRTELPSSSAPVILGGYSSGGHVVATWLSNQSQQQSNSEKDSNLLDWIQGVFFLSGVLSLDSWVMKLVAFAVFGSQKETDVQGNKGSGNTGIVPSPCRQCPPPPSKFRYVCFGCRHETFGIPVLDASFCAQEYTDWLSQEHGIEARCVLVDSNHWSVLNSTVLKDAMQVHLPWLWGRSTTPEPSSTQSTTPEPISTKL